MEQLRLSLHHEEKNSDWNPLIIANSFPDGAKKTFQFIFRAGKERWVPLMLFFVNPTENVGAAPWPLCYIRRFYAPNVQAVVNSTSEIVSIGSGDSIFDYSSILKVQEKDFDVFKLEVGIRGGIALGLTTSISSAIRKMPKKEDTFMMPPVA